jgi:transposase
MIWVGLDVHKRFSRMGSFDPATGDLQDLGEVSNDREELQVRLEQVGSPKTVVLEAGRSSYHMAGLLEPLADEVWIVNPTELRRLQHRVAKTDRRDAAALAWWAAKGALKPLWRPDRPVLELRELTRGRTALTRIATQLRNLIRSLLARHGYECPHRDLLCARGRAWLDAVTLEGYAGEMLAAFRALLSLIQEKADGFEQEVEAAAADFPTAQRLRTIPGIGPLLGLSLAVEIGDISRFPSPGHLRGYSGLTPAVFQSGEKEARGPITKRGNKWLRHTAVLAAQRMSQMHHPDPSIKRTFLSVAFRHGRNPGKVAAARRLLDLSYHLLKKEVDYRAPRTQAASTG